MPDTRAPSAGPSFLRLDQVNCGFLKSVEGGGVSAEVVRSLPGPSFFDTKHLGALRFEDFLVRLDLSLHPRTYTWVAEMLTGGPGRASGSVLATSQMNAVTSEREFSNALLTEITIPAMDANAKDAAFLTLRFAPELTRTKSVSGPVPKPPKASNKVWQVSNFRLEIGGLDCSAVTGIDQFTIRRDTLPDAVGSTREPVLQPLHVEFPDLAITIPTAAARTWLDWREDFLIKGNNAASAERNGRLVFLTPDGRGTLGEVRLFGLGLFRLEPRAGEPEQVPTLTAGLYCQRMEFAGAP